MSSRTDLSATKLTVITVVFNAADRIEDTIRSVLSQDYEDIEYIIKDGGSDDDTPVIVKRYADDDDRIKYVQGPDKGIYDAMNIALSEASGGVIEFLNAGDRFASPDVCSRAMSVMTGSGSDIVFGDLMYENPDGTTDIRRYPQSCAKKIYYLTGDVINHQVIFAKRELFDNALFDTTLKICADREWMMRIRAYTPVRKMTALGFVVAIYPLDGYSVINKERYRREATACIRRHMPLGYPVYAVFEFIRSNRYLAGLLHRLYKLLYMAK
ncbi:MAG: glycosyltransferase [Lachnospiraceae bacterium]|nr:glycosyltransferase [Lachnospiraceae bacterium]